MGKPLVSIIIPVFNREELIKETLDSILLQTYSSWECIVVDDGSTDCTQETVKAYQKRDTRFHLYSRPVEKRKGANSCRNFGFQKSKGRYVQWFDSDDLMKSNFLKAKISAISSGDYDYVISKSEDFLHPNKEDGLGVNPKNYRFDLYNLTHMNYVMQRLNWLTKDFLVKRTIVQNLKFNEILPSGQEYNFLCRLTAISVNAYFLPSILVMKRIHTNSIGGELNKNKKKYLFNKSIIDFETWKDLKQMGTKETKASVEFFFNESIKNSLNADIPFLSKNIRTLSQELSRESASTAFLYLIYQLNARIFGKGHFIRRKFLKQWKPQV